MRLGKMHLVASLVLLGASAASAQEQHHHQHDSSQKLGKVNFPVSCTEAAQPKFNRAVAMLHSFWYEEAEKAFSEVIKSDPGCAMAYWGIAMSHFHPLWAPPNAASLSKGAAAVEKGMSIGAKTEREREYIAAIREFYKDADKLDHRTRSLAYEKAMEQVRKRHPQDREAGIFYALALLGTALPTDKDYVNQRKAAEILNAVLPEEPEHPGVAHYIIHSFDYPQLAQLALPAARSYSKIAASSPHALHMPSHIFTRLGLWQDSIQSNLASAAAAKNHVATTHPGAGSFDQLHAMDYLAYAYLQGGQDRKARGVVDELATVTKLDVENFAAAYAFAAIPARYTLERRSWTDAAALEIHPKSFPWTRFPYAEAITHFARGVGAARSGKLTTARENVASLASIRKALVEAKDNYWADQVEIQRLAAAGWIALAEGKRDEAVQLMRSAADLEDSTEKHPVTPGSVIPARELLGDMLIELKQPERALREYEESLRDAPNRFNSYYGAGRAAELSGDPKKARSYYEQLLSLCEDADSDRAELRHARAFLRKK